jgi:lysine-N-methylase
MALPLSLPTIQQNWSCRSCGGCCRMHEIIVTDAERQRILDQKWTQGDGAPPGMGAFARAGRGRYRLANRADGACVFLNDQNRCRIHAKFGEAAKPLACRIYPFAFHPAGKKVAISLRYSCPTVAANDGASLEEQRKDLLRLRDLVVPADADVPAPHMSAGEQLDWADTLRVVERLRAMLCGEIEAEDGAERPLAMRLVHLLFIAGMLGQAKFQKVRGERLDELMDALITAAPLETAKSPDQIEAPSSLGLTQFRVIAAQYARRDTLATGGMRYRLGMVLAGLKFTRGKGTAPAMQAALPPVAFADLEQPADASQPQIDALMERYYHVKLSGMAFCGAACYGLPVVEGFQSLALIYPLVMYFGRWIARSQGRTTMTLADAQKALGVADHHHGYSPAMAMANFRQRVRWLVKQDEIVKLVAWYSR